jgi:hypothetical protein
MRLLFHTNQNPRVGFYHLNPRFLKVKLPCSYSFLWFPYGFPITSTSCAWETHANSWKLLVFPSRNCKALQCLGRDQCLIASKEPSFFDTEVVKWWLMMSWGILLLPNRLGILIIQPGNPKPTRIKWNNREKNEHCFLATVDQSLRHHGAKSFRPVILYRTQASKN